MGAKYYNKHAEVLVRRMYKFYPAKVLGCLGDGGAILTNNEKIYEIAHSMRDREDKFGVYSHGEETQDSIIYKRVFKYSVTPL